MKKHKSKTTPIRYPIHLCFFLRPHRETSYRIHNRTKTLGDKTSFPLLLDARSGQPRLPLGKKRGALRKKGGTERGTGNFLERGLVSIIVSLKPIDRPVASQRFVPWRAGNAVNEQPLPLKGRPRSPSVAGRVAARRPSLSVYREGISVPRWNPFGRRGTSRAASKVGRHRQPVVSLSNRFGWQTGGYRKTNSRSAWAMESCALRLVRGLEDLVL